MNKFFLITLNEWSVIWFSYGYPTSRMCRDTSIQSIRTPALLPNSQMLSRCSQMEGGGVGGLVDNHIYVETNLTLHGTTAGAWHRRRFSQCTHHKYLWYRFGRVPCIWEINRQWVSSIFLCSLSQVRENEVLRVYILRSCSEFGIQARIFIRFSSPCSCVNWSIVYTVIAPCGAGVLGNADVQGLVRVIPTSYCVRWLYIIPALFNDVNCILLLSETPSKVPF